MPADGGAGIGDADCDGVANTADICIGYDDAADADGDGTPDGCDDEEGELRYIPSLDTVVATRCRSAAGAVCPAAPDYTWGGDEWWSAPGASKSDVLTCTVSG